MESKTLYKSRASWDKESIVVFSEHAELLACDPANVIWVYGVYEYKYGIPDTKAMKELARLVDEMMSCAFRLFNQAADTFNQLSRHKRELLVIRSEIIRQQKRFGRGNLDSSAFRPWNLKRSNTVTRRMSSYSMHELPINAKHDNFDNNDDNVKYENDESNAYFLTQCETQVLTHNGNNNCNKTDNVSLSDHVDTEINTSTKEVKYNNALSELLRHWPLPLHDNDSCNTITNKKTYTRCKVKVCVDMIASRKSLQECPTKSAPYIIGQNVYRYLYKKYAENIVHATVGISDAKVKLTCRDVLFPFKRVVGSLPFTANDQINITSNNAIINAYSLASAKRTKYNKTQNAKLIDNFSLTSREQYVRQTSAFGTERKERPQTADLIHTKELFAQSGLYHKSDNEFNSLVYIRQSPVNAHEVVDQRRLLICFCP